jgi:hypothetical protein
MLQLHRQLKRLALDGRVGMIPLLLVLLATARSKYPRVKASTGSTIVQDKAGFHHSWYINEACLALADPL